MILKQDAKGRLYVLESPISVITSGQLYEGRGRLDHLRQKLIALVLATATIPHQDIHYFVLISKLTRQKSQKVATNA